MRTHVAVGYELALASGWLLKSQAQPGAPGDVASLPLVSIVARLEVVKPEPQLRLTVENEGPTIARLLRLRPGWLEHNGGSLHDWQIQIGGPIGHYQFPRYTGAVPASMESDFIELALGEAFSAVIRVSDAAHHNAGKELRLPHTQGT